METCQDAVRAPRATAGEAGVGKAARRLVGLIPAAGRGAAGNPREGRDGRSHGDLNGSPSQRTTTRAGEPGRAGNDRRRSRGGRGGRPGGGVGTTPSQD